MDHVQWPGLPPHAAPQSHVSLNRGVPCREGPSPLRTGTSVTEVAQEPVSGKCSQLLSWDSFQPDLFLELLQCEATPAPVTGEAEERERMAKDQAGREWETVPSGGFVLIYTYVGITRASVKGRETKGNGRN